MLAKKYNDTHPGDLHDALHSAETQSLKFLGPLSAKWTSSDEYAQLSAALLKATLLNEQMRRLFFPFMPGWEPANQATQLDEMERQMVQSWCTIAHMFTKGSTAASMRERLDAWKEATTVPAKIAQTEKECVFTDGIVKAYRYFQADEVEGKKRIPLLLVFAIMNTPWVLDLHPGHSFVEYMLAQGYDVYLVDWGAPTASEKDWTFETYALNFLPKIAARVKEVSGCDEFSILSWCLGAVISSIYASKRPDEGLKNLILLTAPLDFSADTIVFKKWLSHIDIEQLLAMNDGIMPAALIELGAQTLKPIDNTFGTYLALWHHLDNARFVESWRAMHAWLSMNVSMPGGAYRQLVNDLYLGNKLTKGTFMTAEGPVNLGNEKADVLALIASADHITPPVQTERAMHYFGGNVTIETLDGGHIGVMVGGSAQKQAWPKIEDWLAPRSV